MSPQPFTSCRVLCGIIAVCLIGGTTYDVVQTTKRRKTKTPENKYETREKDAKPITNGSMPMQQVVNGSTNAQKGLSDGESKPQIVSVISMTESVRSVEENHAQGSQPDVTPAQEKRVRTNQGTHARMRTHLTCEGVSHPKESRFNSHTKGSLTDFFSFFARQT